ncbi:MAG TPA: serine/threonine-protein kinase [Gemmatimonadales bacterium]|nr:serine/threonine-protein kinase [Gemmatimonadales bacterium]
MDALQLRAAAALAPRYLIEAEIGVGGMGHVFRARDTWLDRTVAVKVLRPELATARSIERFKREARLLARLNHPNILAIHDSNPADDGGLLYYVMDFAPDETLASRLARGPLSPEALARLTHDLLNALSYAHGEAVIHRDVKPSNIFVLPGRYLLGDFGIARLLVEGDTTDAVTAEGVQPGTLAYMAPEQLAGRAVTPAADLYAAGMVLYEAATGRPWPALATPRSRDWRGVPAWLRPALQRALLIEPAERWPDADAMLAAVRAPVSGPARLARRAAFAVVLLALLLVAGAVLPPSQPLLSGIWPRAPRFTSAQSDLALVPFRSGGEVGRELARFAAAELEWSPRWTFRPFTEVLAWWDSAGAQAEGLAPMRLRSRWWGEGRILHGEERDTLLLILHDSAGRTVRNARVPGDTMQMLQWARDVADTLVREIYPEYFTEFMELSAGGQGNFGAMRALVDGLGAFAADDWSVAESLYTTALVRDSSLGRAAWELRLLTLWRRSTDSVRYTAALATLPAPYHALLAGLDVPNLLRRDSLLRALRDSYPENSRARLLLFDEQLHRGPLVGIPLRQVLDDMRRRAPRDPYLNQVAIYDHLMWGYTHLGERDAAADMWARRMALHAAHGSTADTLGELYNLARVVRFGGVKAALWRRYATWKYGREGSAITPYLRLGGTFDIPEFQRELAIAVAGSAGPANLPAAIVAQAVAALETGRLTEGLAALDSAAALVPSDEMQLQQLEWRVLPAALGLPLADSGSVARARTALAGRAMSPLAAPWKARALWALGADAVLRGQMADALRWQHELAVAGDSAAFPLQALLGALLAGSKDPARALELTDTLFMADRGVPADDPFARAILHLARADWQVTLGRVADADASLGWYENSDLRGWPQGPPQAGEVDQVLSVPARVRRARVLLQLHRTAEACALLSRAAELWRHADHQLSDQLAQVQSLGRSCH